MAHVTFIHGIANKPEAEELLWIWRRALADGGDAPLSLGAEGITSSLVYWADVLYASPDPDVSAHEGVSENSPQAVDGGGDSEAPQPVSSASAAFIEALRGRLTRLSDDELVGEPTVTGTGFERVPLPWLIKKRIMAALLRDVHHYLFNIEFSPRTGETYRTQDEIRCRFVSQLQRESDNGPHVVVSHSMGTVIAYDCLKRVRGCPPVDGFLTLGSPLGLDEVQDQLQPGWSREDGFPVDRLTGDWVNVFDRLDVVCGFDPCLADDYRAGGTMIILDVPVTNEGAWRHSATKYYRQASVRQALRRMLRL